jgi:hypothetical protein
MKHTRLLEIIREEIAGALNEIEKNPPKIAQIKAIDAKQKSLDVEKRNTMKSKALGEDLLNEEPFIDSALDITGTTPENFNQDALQNAIDDAVKVLQQENPDADVKTLAGKLQKANNPVNLGPKSKLSSELKNTLQKVNDVIVKQGQIFGSIDNINDLIKLAKEPSQIDRLEKLKLKGYTFILGNKQAITAIEKSLGLKPKNNDFLGAVKDKAKAEPKTKIEKPASTGKKGRPASEPKSEKTATLTKGDDGFDDVSYSDVEVDDKEATQNIGSDKTAQKLGKAADVSANPDYNRILKGLQTKRKNSKEGVLSPENMKLAIDIINTAKDKYKFTPVEVEKLRAEINL